MTSSSAQPLSSFFFFTDTPPTDIYTLSLHDALPICLQSTAIISRESEYSREGGKDRREIFRGSGRIRILRPRPVSRKNSARRPETRGIPRCRVRTIRRRHRLRPRQRQIVLFLPR